MVINRVYETFMLTPIFLVSGMLSNCALIVALVHGIEDKRWYWLFVAAGAWLWLNLLSTRSPMLLRRMLTNFDALFNISNVLTASLCLSASFGFDERAVAFLLVPFPTVALIVLGDATMDDTDFMLRPYGYMCAVCFFMSAIVADLGHLIKDTESVVFASWGTDGFWFTSAKAIANTTSTENMTFTGDAPWDVTRHTYIQSVSVARLAFCFAYVFVEHRHLSTVPPLASARF